MLLLQEVSKNKNWAGNMIEQITWDLEYDLIFGLIKRRLFCF